MTRRRLLGVLVTLLLVGVLAGCGGGDESPPGEQVTVTIPAGATAAQIALLLGNLMLLVNFAQTVAALVPFRAAGNPVSRPALKAVLS